MKTKPSKELLDALEAEGFEFRSYSGRGMYGKSCFGVTLSSAAELFGLGRCVGEFEELSRTPETDSMGRGIIAYWPNVEPPEVDAEEKEDEEDIDD